MVFTLSNCNKDENKTEKVLLENKDPLPSWNNGKTKTAIINYVKDVTNPSSSNFISEKDRIATFDNDGTLWSEQPMYFQLYFAMDRIKLLAKENPEWKNQQPYKAVLEQDMDALKKQGYKGLIELLMVSHTGMSVEEFQEIVKVWIKTAKHPTKNVGYNQLVYQPMIELLDHLRANKFKTYIVSGGGVDFMRAFVTELYGIPEEQIIGSTTKTKFEFQEQKPKIIKLAEIDNIDDKDTKPLNIQKVIGKKPVFASGNSDGDMEMLQWTQSNKYKSFMLYVHHTDSEREWAYDRNSSIGKLDKGLDEAKNNDWTIINMKSDWKIIYPFELTF
tara:strand:+ start:1654 stop:2646 length:993 start_codon:yes stop_codon:yes gene_type:complete